MSMAVLGVEIPEHPPLQRAFKSNEVSTYFDVHTLPDHEQKRVPCQGNYWDSGLALEDLGI